jgi:hypothetical protein
MKSCLENYIELGMLMDLGRRLVYRFNEVFVIQNIEEGSLFVLFA